MIKYYCCLIATLLVLAACHNNPNAIASKYLNTSNLPEQTFTINTDRDTTVSTKDGIKLFILAKAITADGNAVTLVVKEAILLDEMLKARLTTMSDKGLLASAGMFEIYTKENAVINKPIQVSMPALYADDKMKLYKGKETNGSIEWQDPVPITKTITTFSDMGKVLFTNNCSSCHGINKMVDGPSMTWTDRKKSKQWIRAFVKNNVALRATCDGYSNCIYNLYGHINMPAFPNLSDNDIDAIFSYIDRQTKDEIIPNGFPPPDDCDSCKYYKDYLDSLNKARDSLVLDNGVTTNIAITEPPDADPNADNGTIPTKVGIPSYNPDYYQFNITGFGWYNVDDLLEGKFNSTECNLKVKVQGGLENRVNVFLVIPTHKVFNSGGLLTDTAYWGFYRNDGDIYLPQGEKAFVFAVSEGNGKVYFGRKDFVITDEQTIQLTLHESKPERIMQSFDNPYLDSLNMKVEKTKNFDGLKKIDDEIKRISGKNTDCACEPPNTAQIPQR